MDEPLDISTLPWPPGEKRPNCNDDTRHDSGDENSGSTYLPITGWLFC